MVTVDLKNEGQGDKQRGLTRSEKQLKKFFRKEAKYSLKSRREYACYPDLLDFLTEDAGMMETFLGILQHTCSLDIKELHIACHYYFIYAECNAKEKERVGEILAGISSLLHGITLFNHFIAEKLYHYERLNYELSEIKDKETKE